MSHGKVCPAFGKPKEGGMGFRSKGTGSLGGAWERKFSWTVIEQTRQMRDIKGSFLFAAFSPESRNRLN